MQLTYPWFLWSLGALAVPVVIHLLQLRRPQRMLFTNTNLIREVELVTVRRRKIQHLLVLIARVLGLAALVLLFCQPFIPSGEKNAQVQGVDVLVDASASMQREKKGGERLADEAVTAAQAISTVYPAGVRLQLVNEKSNNLTPVVYRNRLEAVRAVSGGMGLERLGAALGENQRVNPLYIFSDFQRSAFDKRLLVEVPAERNVVLVPFAASAAANIFVDSVWSEDAVVRARASAVLHIRLRNGGEQAITACPVKVLAGQQQVAAFQVAVAAGKTAETVVTVQVPDDQVVLGRVVTEDQPVAFDNTYYFTLRPTSAVQVLEIGEVPSSQRAYENEPLFRYSFSKAGSIDYAALGRADLVLVQGLPQVDAGLRNALRAVVQRGGSVAIVPSATVAGHASYQQLFAALGLGVAQWTTQANVPELREIAQPSAQEPFFREVFGAQQRNVAMPQVAPVLRWSRTGNDILRLRDGDSYLAEFNNGAGRVYVFSAPFDARYSDFTRHALFVPVLYRMALLSSRNELLPAYRTGQGTMRLSTAAASEMEWAPFRLVKDSAVFIPAQRMQGTEARLEVPAELRAAGFYQVQRAGKTVATVAFNAPKSESELLAYSADELRTLVGPNHPNVQVLEGNDAATAVAELQQVQEGRPLWRYFLVAALVALFAEAVLLRFGKRRATGPAVA